jgi:hypothetical protein
MNKEKIASFLCAALMLCPDECACVVLGVSFYHAAEAVAAVSTRELGGRWPPFQECRRNQDQNGWACLFNRNKCVPNPLPRTLCPLVKGESGKAGTVLEEIS